MTSQNGVLDLAGTRREEPVAAVSVPRVSQPGPLSTVAKLRFIVGNAPRFVTVAAVSLILLLVVVTAVAAFQLT